MGTRQYFGVEGANLIPGGATPTSIGAVSAGQDRKKDSRASMGTLAAADFSIDKMVEETMPVPMRVVTLGACVGMPNALFFPSASKLPKERVVARNLPAFKTCWSCPVRQECLEFAMANEEEHGIWGGISQEERAESKNLSVDEIIYNDFKWRKEHGYWHGRLAPPKASGQ